MLEAEVKFSTFLAMAESTCRNWHSVQGLMAEEGKQHFTFYALAEAPRRALRATNPAKARQRSLVLRALVVYFIVLRLKSVPRLL